MCRLFGFRSVIDSQVHRSLLSADNALGTQSHQHPDGWGVAYYVDGAPHVTRSPLTALGDQLFHRLSGGKELFWSTYKTRCSDRQTCASLSPACEAPSSTGVVNHCILSSEPLLGENVWMALKPGDIIGVDAGMRAFKTSLGHAHLPMAAEAL